jgi:hypothetical protein
MRNGVHFYVYSVDENIMDEMISKASNYRSEKKYIRIMLSFYEPSRVGGDPYDPPDFSVEITKERAQK